MRATTGPRARSRLRTGRRCRLRRFERRFGRETADHQKPARCRDEGRRPQSHQARHGEDLVLRRALRAGYVMLAPIRHGEMLRGGSGVADPQV